MERKVVIFDHPLIQHKTALMRKTDTSVKDFRELVKEVNKTFKKRVEFYQIKQNDEGRILSAFGKYGKEIYW